MWLTKIKIAIVEKNPESLSNLIDNIPDFTDIKDIEEAVYLCREAMELLHTLQDETALNMAKIKKNVSFLQSTETPKAPRLDIKL